MQLDPHLTFNGQCEAAFHFYEQCLGAKIGFLMRYRESPMAEHVPSDLGDKILHGSLDIGDRHLSGADATPTQFQTPQGFALTLNIASPEEAENVFKSLSQDGNIQMPMQETFWALRFAMFIDKFGIPWMINCPKPA